MHVLSLPHTDSEALKLWGGVLILPVDSDACPQFENGTHSDVLACLLHVPWGLLAAGKDLLVPDAPQITYPAQVSLLGMSAGQRLVCEPHTAPSSHGWWDPGVQVGRLCA